MNLNITPLSFRNLVFFVLLAPLLFSSCSKEDALPPKKADLALQWADLTLQILKTANRNSPTYSSRSLGYLGLCMYECMVNSDSSMRSLQGQVTGLQNLPQPQAGLSYHWPLVLNAGQRTLLKLLYPTPDNASAALHAQIDNKYNEISQKERSGIDAMTADRSANLGTAIANAIFEWSKTDGGHEGFKKHFDPSFAFPSGAGYWVPPVAGQVVSNFPLHPYWGSNRSFAGANAALPVPAIEPHSTSPASNYYKMYKAVYDKNKVLTQEEKEIAAWWTDDPTETFSPPGHSYNLASIAIRTADLPLMKACETYARVGMATADAFIFCWRSKYTYFNERPSTFVRANIDPNWVQYWPEPPFPAYPSGHATQGAAAATVLEAVFGSSFRFTDNSHEGARRFSPELRYRSRSFNSFWQAAEESAYSRFLGGIHTEQDNETGLREGKKIGNSINAFNWHQ